VLLEEEVAVALAVLLKEVLLCEGIETWLVETVVCTLLLDVAS